MGGALFLCPLELVLPPARGGVGGAGFPVLLWAAVIGEEEVGLGGLGGGLSSSLVFWLSESSRSPQLRLLLFLLVAERFLD